MKTIIAILAIIIVAPILIVVVASREFDGRKYIGRTWEDISRVDRDIHNVNAKGFAIKETSGIIVNSIQINFSNDEVRHAIGVLSKKKMILFDTELIFDELYVSEEKEIRYVGIWPFGRVRIQAR
ncbi:hypothetical protein ACQ4K0_07005 [Burkholderia cepacia]|uniref:hypothetical protein n=1 Tax=Burkholderia cepacia TaxID=292 RepID=UPI0012D8F092|nr:hypothetical protein [Burkholderia cepacia]